MSRQLGGVGDFALFWWARADLVADRAAYPGIWRVREELPEVKDDDIFETILSLVMAGLCRRAPRPCRCGAHQS